MNVMKQRKTVKLVIDTVNEMIDSITKTAVFFSLHTDFLYRDLWEKMIY